MASDEAIRKMVHAIMEKRKELGILDWGQVPIEDVLHRLNQKKSSSDLDEKNQDKTQKEEPDT